MKILNRDPVDNGRKRFTVSPVTWGDSAQMAGGGVATFAEKYKKL